jgi:uncharacterized protein
LLVVGLTNEQEVTVVDKDRPFRINEYLVLGDGVLGEVVETESFNRFQDFNLEKGIVGPELFKFVDYDIRKHTIHAARVRLLVRAQTPVAPGTAVRLPQFAEVRPLLVKGGPAKSLVLGVVHATDNLVGGMDAELQNRAMLLEEGRVLPQNGVPLLFDLRSMQQYPHVGIFGGSGSGKSFGLRVFLEELMKLRIPTLVLDPHYEMTFSATPAGAPKEYRDIKFEERFDLFQVGREVGVNFQALSTRDLQTLLNAASGLSEGMLSAVEALHRRGDTYMGFSSRVAELIAALEGGEKGTDARGIPLASLKGIQWRLERLYRSGLFANDIRPIESALAAGKLGVVQGPIWMLNVFAAYVTSTLYRKRRDYRDARLRGEAAGDYFPPFVLVTDEAHNFAPKAYEAPAKPIIKEIAQEGRKYGVFLILATQRPTLLDETVTAQLNTKCVFRTVRASDIATIKEETDLTQEEARRLPFLRSGDTFISSAIFGRTIAVRIRMAKTASPHTENPFDELVQERSDETAEFAELLEPLLAQGPLADHMLPHASKELAKAGKSLTVERLRSMLEALVEVGLVEKDETFGTSYVWKGR